MGSNNVGNRNLHFQSSMPEGFWLTDHLDKPINAASLRRL